MERKTFGDIREFHLFAGIGGGIYGGELLGHRCCGAVDILPYAKKVLQQRQDDGWMDRFPIYNDICSLKGYYFRNSFDIVCGGFPCQAFSTAAHGKNIKEKNLWGEMLRFIRESDAPIVFGENVVNRAIEQASADLKQIGYRVEKCRLSCSDLGADHQRNRFWLLAVKNDELIQRIYNNLSSLPKLTGTSWTVNPSILWKNSHPDNSSRRQQLLGIGNAQSPYVAASAFRILVNRYVDQKDNQPIVVQEEEIKKVFDKKETWIQKEYDNIGLVHTPTTMANYSCPSMMKHSGCRNFRKVFQRPEPENAEYLMGFPIGASDPRSVDIRNFNEWLKYARGEVNL